MNPQKFQRGFTLVELIMVIVIMGVVGGMVSVFIKSPIDAYFASARRAAMTDTADTTLRRMTRDFKAAVPQSVREGPSGDGQCIEFIPTKTGGRYRTNEISSGDGTSLVFAPAADTTFNMFGDNDDIRLPASQKIVKDDVIVVYNTGQDKITDPPSPGANAYKNDNTAKVTEVVAASAPASSPETKITIESTTFPLADAKRFQVIPEDENIVAYVCDGQNLRRSVRTFEFTDETCPKDGPILARNVTNCKFNYSVGRRPTIALVSLLLQLTESGETITLQHEVHVSTSP